MESTHSNTRDGLLNRPFFWAVMLSASYYSVIFHPRLTDHFLRTYTTHHAVEYVIVALFFWAASDLALRYLSLGRECQALASEELPPRETLEPVANAVELFALVDEAPDWWQNTRIGRRLRRALAYVAERQSADGFRDYLRTLAEEDADQTHSNYAFARFVTAVTPVLGLLGTVVHFGVALGGLDLEHLMDKMPTVISHMGTAFNTTCVALTASLTTLFVLFLVERLEERLVRDVDARTERELLNRFATADANLTPFLDAVQAAKQVTLTAMQEFQRQQAELWSTTLTHEHERWQAQDEAREFQFRRLLAAVESRQTAHAAQVESSAERLNELTQLSTQMAQMLGGEKQLVALQAKLAENLELIHRSQKFDEAMHSLTAAIHLLTARQTVAGGSSRAA
jgi:biopolymer transport protein ExbB/TolQ